MTHKTDEHNENWGGAREGAGRETLGALPSFSKTLRLPGEWKARLDAARIDGEKDSELIRRLIDERLTQIEGRHSY